MNMIIYLFMCVFIGYGVQKNYSSSPNSTFAVSTGVSTAGGCYSHSVKDL